MALHISLYKSQENLLFDLEIVDKMKNYQGVFIK